MFCVVYSSMSNIHAYVHMYIHTCIHTYIHAYIHTYIHTYIQCTYRTVGFLREDFNHANGLIREIKIRVVFSTLHFVSRLQ